jgi:hypothetical protein
MVYTESYNLPIEYGENILSVKSGRDSCCISWESNMEIHEFYWFALETSENIEEVLATFSEKDSLSRRARIERDEKLSGVFRPRSNERNLRRMQIKSESIRYEFFDPYNCEWSKVTLEGQIDYQEVEEFITIDLTASPEAKAEATRELRQILEKSSD